MLTQPTSASVFFSLVPLLQLYITEVLHSYDIYGDYTSSEQASALITYCINTSTSLAEAPVIYWCNIPKGKVYL